MFRYAQSLRDPPRIVNKIKVSGVDIRNLVIPTRTVPKFQPCPSADDDDLLLEAGELAQGLWQHDAALAIKLEVECGSEDPTAESARYTGIWGHGGITRRVGDPFIRREYPYALVETTSEIDPLREGLAIAGWYGNPALRIDSMLKFTVELHIYGRLYSPIDPKTKAVFTKSHQTLVFV
jgi:hypothetical protein